MPSCQMVASLSVECLAPPNSYKAEVIGILLGSEFSPPSTKKKVDCKGAIASTTGVKRPIRHARYVQMAGKFILDKGHRLEWIEGNTGHFFQERSDEYAKYESTLPPHHLPPPLPPGTSSAMANFWLCPIKSGHMTSPRHTHMITSTPPLGNHPKHAVWHGISGCLGSNSDKGMPTMPGFGTMTSPCPLLPL